MTLLFLFLPKPFVKLPAHRAGLPGNVISFYIVPLYPAYKAGLAGHLPVKLKGHLVIVILNFKQRYNVSN